MANGALVVRNGNLFVVFITATDVCIFLIDEAQERKTWTYDFHGHGQAQYLNRMSGSAVARE